MIPLTSCKCYDIYLESIEQVLVSGMGMVLNVSLCFKTIKLSRTFTYMLRQLYFLSFPIMLLV